MKENHQYYVNKFTQMIQQCWEDFVVKHDGHNVRRVVPAKLSIPDHAYGGIDYLECLDCETVSNGKVLFTELKGDKLLLRVKQA